MKRFIERFQLWRQERADEFEDKFLNWLLFFAVLVVGEDMYRLVTTHHLTWSAMISTPLLLAFVILYVLRSRWAWLLLMFFALVSFVGIPFAYANAPTHAPIQVRILSAGIMFSFGAAALVCSLVIRKRFTRGHDTI